MPPSLEAQTRIAELRLKAQSGDMTLGECREAIQFLREERLAMPASASKSRSKKAEPDVGGMLSELGL